MQNLVEILLYMGFNESDFSVYDDLDGSGPYIKDWYSGSPQPTTSELTTAETNWLAEQTAQQLPLAKQNAMIQIDIIAEQARLRYITDGAGQSQIYQEKADQAADYVASGYPVDTSGYPFVQADADVYSITPTVAADNILLKRSEWITVGVQIEQERLNGKNTISNATDVASVNTIRDSTIAALNLI